MRLPSEVSGCGDAVEVTPSIGRANVTMGGSDVALRRRRIDSVATKR